jgi:hypothetical protein
LNARLTQQLAVLFLSHPLAALFDNRTHCDLFLELILELNLHDAATEALASIIHGSANHPWGHQVAMTWA